MISTFHFNKPDEYGRVGITIRSAQEAWSLFQYASQGGDFPEKIILSFEDWPNFEMKVGGRDWHGTVPTRVMVPLLEVQKDLYRAYMSVCHGTDSLRGLRDEEKDMLELVVEVNKGSSEYMAKMAEQLNELAKTALERMNSRDVALTVVGIALVVGGVEVSKSWIASRQAEKQVEQTVELSKQETERLKIFADATKQSPVLASVQADHEASQNRFLKVLKPRDNIVLQGTSLNSTEAAEITQTERARAKDIEVGGVFRVLANDASRNSGFRIKVQRVRDSLTLSADVPIELSDDEKKLIQQAEWSKGVSLVHLNITASELRGKIVNAVVYGAKFVR